MVIVEYYLKSSVEKHTRYFPTLQAARNFFVLLKNDPECAGVRVVQ
jgi:hypothetical protein